MITRFSEVHAAFSTLRNIKTQKTSTWKITVMKVSNLASNLILSVNISQYSELEAGMHFPILVCSVDACALTSILPLLSLMDMIYCTAHTKATPASVEGVGVDF
jgi:hypothetical protein